MHSAGPASNLLLRRAERRCNAGGETRAPCQHKRRYQRDAAYRVIGGLVPVSACRPAPARHCCQCCIYRRTSAGAALVALVAIGAGLIFPRFEQLLEKPFSRIRRSKNRHSQQQFRAGSSPGRVVCRRPDSGYVVVAGATATSGWEPSCSPRHSHSEPLPLLFFALAGQRIAERVGARRRQR